MNQRKFLAIITMIAVMITTVIPALGASGDGTGSAEWPANINISESTLETSSYQFGDVKEFQMGYYPENSSGAVIEANRHIEITGPAAVANFEFSENGETWKPIDEFEGKIRITTTTIHRARVAFQEEGAYTLRLWITDDGGELIKESRKEIYVSAEGIYVRPNAPTDLKETESKLNFTWQYNANKEVKYNFYIDDLKVNTEEITLNQYDASEFKDKLTPGVHKISVTSVLVKENAVMSKVESAPITIEYIVEAPSTEPESTSETETVTEENTTTGADTTTSEETTSEKITVDTTTENQTTSEIESTTKEDTTPDVTPTTGETSTPDADETTGESITTETPVAIPESTTAGTATEKITTTAPSGVKVTTTAPKNIKLAKGKIIKASKKTTSKKIKITFKKIKKATAYEVQICKNKKFKKRNITKKTVKKNKCVFKKLKAHKRYYVRVRAVAFSNGKKIYGKWSSKKRIKLKK